MPGTLQLQGDAQLIFPEYCVPAGIEGYISAWLYSIKRYIRFLTFSRSLKYSWELRVHYIFYLFYLLNKAQLIKARKI